MEALNSAPIVTAQPHTVAAAAPQPQPPSSNADFRFGFEKANAMAPQPPIQQQMMGRAPEMEDPVFLQAQDERSIAMDPIQKQIQDLQRLTLEEQQQGVYRRNSDDNLSGVYHFN